MREETSNVQGVLLKGEPPSLINREVNMDREELKARIDELMRQYHDEEIDGATYAKEMMELTSSAQE